MEITTWGRIHVQLAPLDGSLWIFLFFILALATLKLYAWLLFVSALHYIGMKQTDLLEPFWYLYLQINLSDRDWWNAVEIIFMFMKYGLKLHKSMCENCGWLPCSVWPIERDVWRSDWQMSNVGMGYLWPAERSGSGKQFFNRVNAIETSLFVFWSKKGTNKLIYTFTFYTFIRSQKRPLKNCRLTTLFPWKQAHSVWLDTCLSIKLRLTSRKNQIKSTKCVE